MSEPLRFFLDQHIPSAIANALRLRGIDVSTAQDTGRCGLGDPEQLQFAMGQQRVVVTFDPDYLALDLSGVQHAGIAWCPAAKYSVRQLIHALLLVHAVLSPDDMRNYVEYL